MNQPIFALAVTAALCCPAPASRAHAQAAPPAAVADFKAEFDALVERLATAQRAFEAELEELYSNFDYDSATDEAKAEFQERWKAAQAKAPGATFQPEFAALAERAKGSDIAAKSWMQVIQLAPQSRSGVDEPSVKALDRLVADHVASEALAELPQHLQYGSQALGRKKAKEALKAIRAGSPHKPIQASCLFALGNLLMDSETEGHDRAQAREAFVELQREFGTLKPGGYHEDATYAQLAEPMVYDLDHLQLHMLAPDFSAVDQDGVAFKLSDYKGKVVVVDFWGNW